MDIKIVYHYHSGFSVQCDDTLLIFDYWRGEYNEIGENGRITESYLKQFKHVYVFVSHAHPDHFDSIIYEWKEIVPNITYILSKDIQIGNIGKRIQQGMTREFDDILSVTAYESTDLGVAFLVHIGGRSIFHAGDLNLWHWRQESTIQEIEDAEAAFYHALEPLKGEPIDVAMFPVDPRQGLMYDAGANHFIMSIKPQVLIPMHWQDRADVAIDFARRSRTPQTEVIAMTKPGSTASIQFNPDRVDIKVIEPPKEISTQAQRSDPISSDSPFADTDLPVKLDLHTEK